MYIIEHSLEPSYVEGAESQAGTGFHGRVRGTWRDIALEKH
jgi:hypothetical protein